MGNNTVNSTLHQFSYNNLLWKAQVEEEYICAMACMWRSKNNLSQLFFHQKILGHKLKSSGLAARALTV